MSKESDRYAVELYDELHCGLETAQVLAGELFSVREELKAAHELAKKTDRILLHARLTASFFACSIKSGEEWSEEHVAAMQELSK